MQLVAHARQLGCSPRCGPTQQTQLQCTAVVGARAAAGAAAVLSIGQPYWPSPAAADKAHWFVVGPGQAVPGEPQRQPAGGWVCCAPARAVCCCVTRVHCLKEGGRSPRSQGSRFACEVSCRMRGRLHSRNAVTH